MKRIIILLISATPFCGIINAQNIGVNATGAAPNASAILDFHKIIFILIPNFNNKKIRTFFTKS